MDDIHVGTLMQCVPVPHLSMKSILMLYQLQSLGANGNDPMLHGSMMK